MQLDFILYLNTTHTTMLSHIFVVFLSIRGCDVYFVCSGFTRQMTYLENRKELCGATHICILFKRSTIDSCWCSVNTGHLTKPKTQNLSKKGSYNAKDLIIRFFTVVFGRLRGVTCTPILILIMPLERVHIL